LNGILRKTKLIRRRICLWYVIVIGNLILLYVLYQIASQWLAYVILLCYTISNVVLSKNFLSIQRIVSRNIAIA